MPVVKKNIENNGVNLSIIEDRARGAEFVASGNPKEGKEKNDKLFTIRTSGKKQREYKAFFASKGLSLSKGVQIAIDYLICQSKKGQIELKDTGIYTR